MIDRASLEVEITLLATSEGGRTSPLALDHPTTRYRPHLVVGDPLQSQASRNSDGSLGGDYLGVEFRRTDFQLSPGDSANVSLELMYPGVDYGRLVPGATFTIREGPKIVGFGTVLERTDAI
jgi:hypothetical protein